MNSPALPGTTAYQYGGNVQHHIQIGIAEVRLAYKKLVTLALLVWLAHCTVMLIKYRFGYDMMFGLVPLFDFYEEHNVPTYFSSVNLLLTAGILYFIAKLKRREQDRHATPWFVLAGGFLFMSLDEFADLRIVLSSFIKSVVKNDHYAEAIPFFSVAWTVPVFVIVVVLAFYFIPFVLSLKRIYALNFAIAGGLFVFAAIGLETAGGNQAILTHGVRDLTFMWLVTLEETMEIGSILYFQYFLIRYIGENFSGAKVGSARPAPAPAVSVTA